MSNSILNNRIMIAATGSGCGKTTITTGILCLLKNKGFDVHSFKCGPDYIDPMYHESVLGIPSKNLDPFFEDEDLLKASFLEGMGEVNVIEACMGLFDGLGVSSSYSSYSVAAALRMPIILVIDGHGMGYSIVALIKGFLSMDTQHLIKGVFLNRVSEGFSNKLAPTIYQETGLSVIGCLPTQKGIEFESRHLGLKSTDENGAFEKIQRVAESLNSSLKLNTFLDIHNGSIEEYCTKQLKDFIEVDLTGSIIAVAKDAAFNFYYRDNLLALELSGAKIIYFSPLKDKRLPEGITAIYLGGGYPENYLDELSSNIELIEDIRNAIECDIPVFAECGGFMYLNGAIEDRSMVGIFNDQAVKKNGLVRFGYVELLYNSYRIKGHEFHHFDVNNPGDLFKVEKASTKEKYFAYKKYRRCIAGFPHLFFFSCPAFLKEFK